MKTSPQILPEFQKVANLSRYDLSSASLYDKVYRSERMNKSAWLIDEKASLADFIDSLGQADAESDNPPLNLYNFYAACNINFPFGTVRLIDEIRLIDVYMDDLASLLRAITSSRNKYLQHAVFLDARRVPAGELYELRCRIIQQFINLRMYMPVIIAESYSDADWIFQDMLNGNNTFGSLSVFGTKKAGKSTLINAMLGGEYAPSSAEVPTPCRITYSEGSTDGKITLECNGSTHSFSESRELKRFLTEEFRRANKRTAALAEMRITLPAGTYPAKLKEISLIDTPGSNFAASVGHHNEALSALADAERVIFVMNYAVHLSTDEESIFKEVYGRFNGENKANTIIIALNRIDEMYAAEVVKSYERAADYIAGKLRMLGYSNFLIVPISALTEMCAQKLSGAVRGFCRKLSKRLNKSAHGDDKDAAIFLCSKVNDMKNFHDINAKSIRELSDMSRVKYMMHVIRHI